MLAQRCEEIGRDPKTLTTSAFLSVVPVEATADTAAVRVGLTPYMQQFAVIGTPEQVAEHVAEKILPTGVGGLALNMPFSGHVPGTVRAVGEALAPLLT